MIKAEAGFVGLSAAALTPMGTALVSWVASMIEMGAWIPMPESIAQFFSVAFIVPLLMLWQRRVRKHMNKPEKEDAESEKPGS